MDWNISDKWWTTTYIKNECSFNISVVKLILLVINKNHFIAGGTRTLMKSETVK